MRRHEVDLVVVTADSLEARRLKQSLKEIASSLKSRNEELD